MITNPSCQNETPKEPEQKFVSTNYDEDVLCSTDHGGGNGPVGGQGGVGGTLTDLSGYNSGSHNSYSQHGGHNHYNGHYSSHYNSHWTGQHQDPYNYYNPTNYYPTNHYQHYDQWNGQQAPGMVLPPGPSPTGSNNSPSPHGFSDNNESGSQDSGMGPHRADLKRPSPDSFIVGSGGHLGGQQLGPPHALHSGHHQQTHPSVAKKPKVSKRRKKRDPNEPTKPVSAYALFFRDTQASIKMRSPGANFGEVSKIVAATWDALDPDSKAAYKKRTEMAKKEYLRALAAYRANMVSKGSGHDLYGGFPGYGPMLVNGGMEQAMPATGLGPTGPGMLAASQGLPPHYNGAPSPYHPGYMQQIHPHHGQHGQQHSPGHHGQQHSPGQQTESHSPKLEERLTSFDGVYRPPNYPPHSQGGGAPGGPTYPGGPNYQPDQSQQFNVNRTSGKCGRPGCSLYSPGYNEFCSSECVMGECKEAYSSWSSCMVKPGQGGPSPDVMVK